MVERAPTPSTLGRRRRIAAGIRRHSPKRPVCMVDSWLVMGPGPKPAVALKPPDRRKDDHAPRRVFQQKPGQPVMIRQQGAPADAQDKDGSQAVKDKPGRANLATEK